MNRIVCLLALLPTLVLAEDEYEQAPIRYSKTEPNDGVRALERLIEAGKVPINRSTGWTVLKDVMKRLNIPEESQVLVFSKTSKQNDLISPQTPRAVYFGDNAYVGYCLGGVIEIATIDPLLGPIFYTLDPDVAEDQPLRFERDQSCLSCHGGTFTSEIPGLLVRSVFPAATGHPLTSQGSTLVDTTTPFVNRWGGWYVTGKHGDSVHRGNVTATEKPGETCEMPVEQGANVTELASFFDVSAYPRQQSDIVALMVLEHQTSVQNILTKANQTCLRAMDMQMNLQKELAETIAKEPVGTARRIMDSCAEDVLDALLFKDEAVLPKGGIEGNDAFQMAFARNALRSGDGRSLKDFQLLNRLFKYRCSYMIHSVTFQHLMPALKKTVLTQLQAVLEGRDTSGRYAYLLESERRHITKILAETKVLSTVAQK